MASVSKHRLRHWTPPHEIFGVQSSGPSKFQDSQYLIAATHLKVHAERGQARGALLQRQQGDEQIRLGLARGARLKVDLDGCRAVAA